MKSRTIKVLVISILIGVLVSLHALLISGANPVFDYFFKGILLLLLVYCCLQILKEQNRKRKLFQILILIGLIGLGLFVSKCMFGNLDDTPTRRYQVDQDSDYSLKNDASI